MRTIILAGGEGKRLRPVTCTMPKPLVPLLNKPTLYYTLELLKKHGLTDVTLTLGCMGSQIRRAVGDGSPWGLSVKYSEPTKRLGTAGSVRYALSKNEGDTLLIMSGDGLTDLDLTSAASAHKSSGAAVTVVLSRVAEPSEYGIAMIDEKGFIKSFLEKPSPGDAFSDYANTGIYLIEPRVLNELGPNAEKDFSKDVFPGLLKKGAKLFGYLHRGYWSDVGCPSELLRTQRDMLEGRCAFSTQAASHDGVFIEPDAVISPKAKLVAPCYIGRSAQIGAYACVDKYSVVCSGARLEEDTQVKRSMIMSGAVLRRGAEACGAIVCENAVLENDSAMYEGSAVGAESVIGAEASVCPGVLIWPQKYVERGEKCRSSVRWGERKKLAASCGAFYGRADESLTPELALRLAAAYAAQKELPAEMAVGCDGSAPSVMLKHAVASGVTSMGVDVLDSEASGKAAFAALIRHLGASGGVYAASSGEDTGAELTLFDSKGIEASEECTRAVERALVFGEQKPTTRAELGVIRRVGGGELMLGADALRGVDARVLKLNPKRLILNAEENLCRETAQVLLKCGWRVSTAFDGKKLIPVYDGETISALVEGGERVSVFISPDTALDHHSLLAAIALEIKPEAAVLPLETDPGLEDKLEAEGVKCTAGPEEPALRRRLAVDTGAYESCLLEPAATVVKLCEMFSSGALQRAADELPACSKRSAECRVARGEAARLMRRLGEIEAENVCSMAGGVKLKLDTGWVTVRPCGDRPAFRVASGGSDAEYAKELCDIYLEKLKSIKKERDE